MSVILKISDQALADLYRGWGVDGLPLQARRQYREYVRWRYGLQHPEDVVTPVNAHKPTKVATTVNPEAKQANATRMATKRAAAKAAKEAQYTPAYRRLLAERAARKLLISQR
jgi:hypothetical protein